MTISAISLAYTADSSRLFARLRDLPWPIFCDSCQPQAEQGRYDYISAAPAIRLVTFGAETQIMTGEKTETSMDDPFHLLKSLLQRYPLDKKKGFYGGAMGYFSYDLGRRLENIGLSTEKDIQLPDMAVGIYDWVIAVDHHEKTSYLYATHFFSQTQQIIEQVQKCLKTAVPAENTFNLSSDITSNMTKEEYSERFYRIKQHIVDGDCYQVNLSQRLSAEFTGSPWEAYCKLRTKNPAPYAAFMEIEEGAILSMSPERFIHVENGCVSTKPIKGTRPRGNTKKEDRDLADALLKSEKDRAENVMIVDLLRNDLGKCCKVGSIKVPELCALESFPSVHHLVSKITGELADDMDCTDLLRACFPGGSITGAPKVRAMQIIEDCEKQWRSIYCGSVGYIGFNQQMDTNIGIRTLICENKRLHCSAGGGLVADSDMDEEYQETFDKIALIMSTMSRLAN